MKATIAETNRIQSCLYEGRVRHSRLATVRHAFEYRLYFAYLDLSEVETLFGRHGFWSTRRPAFAELRRSDHFGDPDIPLDSAVRELIHERSGRHAPGPIRLLTNFRLFGYLMNPVSFYYCFDEHDERVEFVVAEVTNTPWRERHCYVLDLGNQEDSTTLRSDHRKELHVSPFLEMDMEYRWRLTAPGERLQIRIENFRSGQKLFDAHLALRRVPMTRGSLARMALRYPFLTIQIALQIYWQAFRLWWQGVPFVPHPRTSESRESNIASSVNFADSRIQVDPITAPVSQKMHP